MLVLAVVARTADYLLTALEKRLLSGDVWGCSYVYQ
jgi:hypothetical protein